MRKTNKELINFTKKYQNKWVALDPKTKEVLASNKDLETLVENLESKKKDYFIEKVVPANIAFIP
jgi:hypothetical protein